MSLQKKNRIKKRKEFIHIQKNSFKYNLEQLVVYVSPSHQSRLGITVSKKVSKKAVERNHIKRLIKEAWRKEKFQNYDIVLIVKKNIKDVSFDKMTRQLKILKRKLQRKTMKEEIEIFRKYLDMIESDPIRNFTLYALQRVPDYFWTLPASTSGRRHGGSSETLIDHILGCLYMAEAVCDQFDKHWTQRQKDQLIASIILHDGWRCGEPGNETRITQEMIDKRGYAQEKLGDLCTSRDHPEVGFRQLLMLATDFNRLAQQENTGQIAVKDLSIILKAVRYHYGPWMDVPEKPFSLSWPYDSVVIQCHNIDYHQAKNASWWCCRKGE